MTLAIWPAAAISENVVDHWSHTTYYGSKNGALLYSGTYNSDEYPSYEGGGQWSRNLDQRLVAPYELVHSEVHGPWNVAVGVEYWMPMQYWPEEASPACVNAYVSHDFYAFDSSAFVDFSWPVGAPTDWRAQLDNTWVYPVSEVNTLRLPVGRGWHRLVIRAGSGLSESSFIAGRLDTMIYGGDSATPGQGVSEGPRLQGKWDFSQTDAGQAQFTFTNSGGGGVDRLELHVADMLATIAPAGWDSSYDAETGLLTLIGTGDSLEPGEEMVVQVTFDQTHKVAVLQAMQFSGSAGPGALESMPAIVSVSVPAPGDANRDGLVSDADYTIWADNYGATNGSLATGDFNGDWEVTDADYTIWADHYGSAAAAVPEPGAMTLLAVVGVVCARRRPAGRR